MWKPGIPQSNNPARETITFHQTRCSRCGKDFEVGDRVVFYWSQPNRLDFLHPETCCSDIPFKRMPRLKWTRTATPNRQMAGGPDGTEYEILKEKNDWGLLKNNDIPLYLGPSLKAALAVADLDAYMPNYTPPGYLSERFAGTGRAVKTSHKEATQEESVMAVATKSSKKKVTKETTKAPAAEKSTSSATEEEFKAAVEGTLKPRKEAGARNQDALKAKGEDDKPSGRPLGITTGLPIRMYWALLFQKNDKAPKSQKMTNEQISDAMRKEFPGRDSAVFDSVAYVRRQFNTGVLTRGMVPKYQSVAYDENGNAVEGRATNGATTGKGGKKGKKPDAGIRTIDGDEADKPSAMDKIRNSPGVAKAKKKVIKA